jgi:predicted site-specific integrase-resolvase
MRKLTPKAYLDEFYPGLGIVPKTVVNWIKAGKVKGDQTPTGRWFVMIDPQPESNVSALIKMMEACA